MSSSSSSRTQTQARTEVVEEDWNEIVELDKKYFLHNLSTQKEYEPLPIARADGNYLIDAKGNRILDFMSQLYCVNLGQRPPEVIKAIKDALDRYGFIWEGFTSDYRAKAAKLIVEDLLGKDGWAGKVRFVSSGSEAVEEALMIAKLYTGRRSIITQQYGYHGWTHGAGQLTRLRRIRGAVSSSEEGEIHDIPGFDTGNILVVPAPFCFRCPLGQKYPDCMKTNDEGKLACVKQAEKLIEDAGPENFAAMIMEVAFGAGTFIPPKEYLPQMVSFLKRHGIVYIDDEVICGFGRTGKWFGYQHFLDKGVKPDIMTMGKGIVSSALPAAGLVVNQKIAKWFEDYRWWHVATYGSHPVAMAAVVANIEAMKKRKVPEQAALAGEYLGNKLRELERKHKCIGKVDGMGLFWEVEIVKNKKTGEPFVKEDRDAAYSGDTSKYPTEIIKHLCFEKGLLCAGFAPNSLRIGPNLTISEKEIDEGIRILDSALTEIDKMCD
jgi:taurine--2-oxoglutarate transaminase